MKEASHFLRNMIYCDIAIIDFHILNILRKYGLISDREKITNKRYIEIERLLDNISKKLKITLSKLDLYLWYLETGKVLK